ncbi:ArnT family glycosyltransferase [Microlunatus speluncae]|uniref:ArnT family glycosyltransferase n=1 Tax=Microlunatus speluncae TaxID=2594267 RepID=UPI001266831B|nr:glycosyltransferase family 39 protein [Microlunatus speluncae]
MNLRRPRSLIKLGSLLTLLAGTAALYLWGLTASGYANSFYSAAVQAGSMDWTAFLFGSLDPGNSITVDKPPASLWLMALSVRLFGLSSASILVPQALLGVATVGVLYATVRRTSGHWGGIAAGVILALTPAAALMFRFNNPDALLVFLMTLAGYATLRAIEQARGRWLVLAGVAIGFAFLTKMLQAFLVLPAFAVVYLIAAPARLRTRLLHLLAAFAAMIVSLGWWVALVELLPAQLRPYIGGSQHNSVLELIFGYNGLGRITGEQVGSVGGSPGGGWGETGPTRLFDSVSGGMISWLIPAALILAVVATIAILTRPRPAVGPEPAIGSARLRLAAIMIFGGWLLLTGLVFSFMAGIYHDYYTVALAPAIAGVTVVAAAELWQQRARWLGRIGLAAAAGATTVWAVLLLARASEPYPSLRIPIAVIGGLATIGLLFAGRLPRIAARAVIVTAGLAALAGPTAYSLHTVANAHQGSIVTAGPVEPGPGSGGMIIYGPPPGQQQDGDGRQGRGQGPGAGGPRELRTGGPGGLLGGGTVSEQLAARLKEGSAGYTWAAATTGSQAAASYQLATGLAVMAIGGFNGSDPSPTLAEFQQLVAEGKIHYYLGGDDGQERGRLQNGGSRVAEEISTWVSENFTKITIDGVTGYDLSQAR